MRWIRIVLGTGMGLLGFVLLVAGLFLFHVMLVTDIGDGTPLVFLFLAILFLAVFVASWPDLREIPAFFSQANAQRFCAVGVEICTGICIALDGYFILMSRIAGLHIGKIYLGIVFLVPVLVLNSRWLYRLFRYIPGQR